MCLYPRGAVPSLHLQLHTQLLPCGRVVHAKEDFWVFFIPSLYLS